MSDLLDLTAAQGGARRSPPASSTRSELFEAYRARAAGDTLNAFVWVAERRRRRTGGPLGGVPLAVKDLFCTEGVPSQSGSRILEGYRPPYTATVVARLAAAGAPLLGKTNQDEFAMGSSTENSAFGPTLNPWDRSARPGRLLGRQRRRGRGAASRRGRSAPTPAARSASPPRSAASSA